MLILILLLTPVYITLFWSIVLNTETTKTANTPKIYLGKFMITAFIIYFSHFLYFSPYYIYYPLLDSIYQFASLMAYPMFYIYVRLLTVDETSSLRKHAKYYLPSAILFACYSLGIFFNLTESTYMTVVRTAIKITFVLQVIISVTANFQLIRKYGDRVKHYYSNIEDSRMNKIQLLNSFMIITAAASVTLGIMGREAFTQNIIGLTIASTIFSVSLFLIGWLGNKQTTINPTFDEKTEDDIETKTETTKKDSIPNDLECKLNFLLVQKKLYLNSKLTIKDLSLNIGTNRTDLSNYINSQYKKNFCSYINTFRVNEMHKIKQEHPEYTQSMLAEMSGFGSVDSMKRAIRNAEDDTIKESSDNS